jgi:hypothetical protein
MNNNKGIDWQGLYNWSMKYQDGTKISQAQPMSQEDRKWLEAAMKEYTFNDADRLKEISEQLKEDLDSGFNKISSQNNGSQDFGLMIDLLDELTELTEIHERNNLNLALCGGL